MGVPQVSVLGPLLWNILYNGVLRIVRPAGTKILAYADDLAIVVTDSSEAGMTQKRNMIMRSVDRWLASHGLDLAPEETEAVIFNSRKMRTAGFHLRGKKVEVKPAVKYLGVWFDRHLKFNRHVVEVAKKAESTATTLARIMPNIGGPSSRKRRALANVVDSVILYAAPI